MRSTKWLRVQQLYSRYEMLLARHASVHDQSHLHFHLPQSKKQTFGIEQHHCAHSISILTPNYVIKSNSKIHYEKPLVLLSDMHTRYVSLGQSHQYIIRSLVNPVTFGHAQNPAVLLATHITKRLWCTVLVLTCALRLGHWGFEPCGRHPTQVISRLLLPWYHHGEWYGILGCYLLWWWA